MDRPVEIETMTFVDDDAKALMPPLDDWRVYLYTLGAPRHLFTAVELLMLTPAQSEKHIFSSDSFLA